jgi:hypothetical protein
MFDKCSVENNVYLVTSSPKTVVMKRVVVMKMVCFDRYCMYIYIFIYFYDDDDYYSALSRT